MKQVNETELDFEDHEEVALDYFLNGEGETKEQWAKRVWDSCKRCADGEEMPAVYKCMKDQTWKDRAKQLWANKKLKRKEALVKQYKLNDDKESLMAFKLDDRYKIKVERKEA